MSVSAGDSLGPGVIVDKKYRLAKLLGTGGMGEVYEAVNLAINRRVAIKLMHPRLDNDERFVGRLQNEAKVAGSIDHENICDVFDLGVEEGGRPYLVMPLLKGLSLGRLLNDGGIATSRLLDIIRQTLSALQAAHDHGVVHRDLKPDNVFIAKSSERDDFVKLLDFGICKVIDADFDSALTRSGMVVGTPTYMSPEQARGGRYIDHRADIYAVGVIMYRALTGRLPFEGESYNEVIIKITTEQFPSPQSIRPSIPSEIEKIVLRAMSRDPAERYASAREMRREIEGIDQCLILNESDVQALDQESGSPAEDSDDIIPTAADTKCDRHDTASNFPGRAWRRVAIVAAGGTALVLALVWLGTRTTTDENPLVSTTEEPSVHSEIDEGASLEVLTTTQTQPAVPSTRRESTTISEASTTSKSETSPAKPTSPKPVPRLRGKKNKSPSRRREPLGASSGAAGQTEQQRVISGRFGTVVYSEYKE